MASAMSTKQKRRKQGHRHPAIKGKDYSFQVIIEMCKSLDENWKVFGNNLGFSQEQLKSIQENSSDIPESVSKMMGKWKEVVVHHTLNYIPLLYVALTKASREDLASQLLEKTNIAKPDNEYLHNFGWNELVGDLRAVRFESHLPIPLEESDAKHGARKKKKSRRQRTYYYFNNCENVIVGDGATMKITSHAQDGLENPEVDDHSKEAIILNILKSLLFPTKQTEKRMKIQKLESSFMKMYVCKGEKAVSFVSLVGIPLMDFIRKHDDEHFKMQKEHDQWYISLSEKSIGWQKSFASLFSHGTSNRNTQSVKNTCGETESENKSLLSEAISPSDLKDQSSSDEEQEWTKVTNFKHTKRRNIFERVDHTSSYPELTTVPFNSSQTSNTPKKSYASVVSSGDNPFQSKQLSGDKVSTGIKTIVRKEKNIATDAKDERKMSQEKQAAQELRYSRDARDFMNYMKHFKKGHFALVCGKQKIFDGLETLALVPWLCVLDLDTNSRRNGLLSVLEHYINETRGVYVCSWKDPPRISEHVTEWCLMRGNSQEADSITPDKFKEWFRRVLKGLECHLRALSNFIETYTVIKIVVLWPDEADHENVQYIHRLLLKMEEYLDPPPKVIIIHSPSQCLMGNTLFEMMDPDFTLSCHTRDVCLALRELKRNRQRQEIRYQLPTADETNNPKIAELTASTLREDLEILYIDSPYRKSEVADFEDAADHFFRGGTLHWRVFYECGVDFFVAERDIMRDIEKRIIDNFIQPFRSGFITLYHAPGAGGTTLAQRLLWELRKVTPCAQIKMKIGSSITALADQIENLYNRTKLPLLLMVDGEDQRRVKHLVKQLLYIAIIIIRVKRYPYAMNEKKLKDNDFWLKGEVSAEESNQLYFRFSRNCDDDTKKKDLMNIVDEVKCKTADHRVYEFGLVTYVHEYKGLDGYVRGYLDINETNHKLNDLQPFQKIAGYLALAYYYGQASIPCQFFVHLLGKPNDYEVAITDFPYQVRELVVSCEYDGKKNGVRIGHYEVAKVILEQLLTWKCESYKWTNRTDLSSTAKGNLYSFAIKFIEDAKSRKGRKCGNTGNVHGILARTFIYRDNQDVGEGETQSWRRPALSKLLTDIDKNPPYTYTVQIMEKLTKCFPENPNFHAHLGRIYAICRPEEEENAEECFKRALSLCHSDKHGSLMDEGERLTLTRIYHMYGMFYLRRISKFTGRRFGDKPEHRTEEADFGKRIAVLLDFAERACDLFKSGRQLSLIGSEEMYGYVGEITVKLQVCNFIYKHTKALSLSELLKDEKEDTELISFVRESITDILELFMQCYNAVEPEDLGRDFHLNILWYNELFKEKASSVKDFPTVDNVQTRRLKAAAIKLNYGNKENLGIISNITSQTDIEEIISICEMNFQVVISEGSVSNRRALDLEYRDWLQAIRHDKCHRVYPLDEVLIHVRNWYECLKSPWSTFYLFVLLSVLGLAVNSNRANIEMLVEASQLKYEMKKMRGQMAKPRNPREWFGKGNTIRCLITENSLARIYDSHTIMGENLWLLKGTISRPNNEKQSGFIELDQGQNDISVKIFFVPIRTKENLVGRSFAGARVEFVMGFTSANGYEAYNVAQLKKYPCLSCGTPNELLSNESFADCLECGNKVNSFSEFEEL